MAAYYWPNSSPPSPPALFYQLLLGSTVIFSGLLYSLIVNDPSPSKQVRLLRTLAAALLAPFLASYLSLFIGFTLLDWRL